MFVGVFLLFGRLLADESMVLHIVASEGLLGRRRATLCVMMFGILTEGGMLVHEYCHSWSDAVGGLWAF